MNKINRVSMIFRVLFQLILICYFFIVIVGWASAPGPLNILVLPHYTIRVGVLPASYMHSILHPFGVTDKLLGFLANLIPMLIDMFVLHSLIKLFQLYEKAELFSMNVVRYLRNIGYGLLLGQIVYPFYEYSIGFILVRNNLVGNGHAGITLDQTNFGVLVLSLVIILISWIMSEGYKLRDDQEHTI